MAVRKLKKSWQYDFKIDGRPRQRKGGFRTRAECEAAEKAARHTLITGSHKILLSEAYRAYLAATRLKDRSRDSYEFLWKRIGAAIGHLYLEEVDTSAMDRLKQSLPGKLGPKTVNQHLILLRAVLRFMWKRGRLTHVPYVPMEKVPAKRARWYTQEQRDRLLDGFFRQSPEWYLFFYITCRLGLRRGEVYGLQHRHVERNPLRLLIDGAMQRGKRGEEAKWISRKNGEEYTLELTQDVPDAVDWHVEAGYAGSDFLFSKTGAFPRYLDSYVRPLQRVQRAQELPLFGHHAVGRHSVASQAATGGESIKAIQAQLGHRSEQSTHRYAHLGSGAQLRLITSLQPTSPPHVNHVSTEEETGTQEVS